MHIFRAAAARTSFVLAAIAGVATVTMMLIICADVALRALGSNVPGTLEIVSYYLMVMVAFLPIAQIERHDQMISVDSIYSAVPRRARLVLSALVAIGLAITYAGITYVTWLDAVANFNQRSFIYVLTSIMPIWPVYFIVPIAFGLATLVMVERLFDIGRGQLPEESSEIGGGMSEELGIKAGML